MEIVPIKRIRDTNYRSDEEMYLSWYLDELQEAGYITGYDYENDQFVLGQALKRNVTKYKALSTKVSVKTAPQVVLKGNKSYTPDFTIYPNWKMPVKKLRNFFCNVYGGPALHNHVPFNCTTQYKDKVLVEVKPSFDRNNMSREFVIVQKFLWTQQKRLVNLIKPVDSKTCLFASTFTPERYIYTDETLRKRSITHDIRTLTEYEEMCEEYLKHYEAYDRERKDKERSKGVGTIQ